MRRRVWALVRMTDVFFSHQVSLPTMISEDDCDTELPHNIRDEDFGPDTKVLPPPRPDTEPTAISYMINKVRLCLQLGAILRATARVRSQVHYDEILRFDARLRDFRAGLPPHLKMQPLGVSDDPPQLIMARFNMDILYLKIVCLLHRKYIPRARHNPRYAHSRRCAIEASLETLRHLGTLHRESQPTGRLHSIEWFFKSVAAKDFLLPAMLIALDLHHDNEARKAGEKQPDQHFWTRQQRDEMISRLELTRDIWKGLADISVDALKASNILDIMLAKIKKSTYEGGAASSPGEPVAAGHPSAELRREPASAMTLDMVGNGAMPSEATGFSAVQGAAAAAYTSFDHGLETADVGLGSSTRPSTEAGAGNAAAPGVPNAMLGFDAAQSPLAMFDSMGSSSSMDFSANFDWVRMPTLGGGLGAPGLIDLPRRSFANPLHAGLVRELHANGTLGHRDSTVLFKQSRRVAIPGTAVRKCYSVSLWSGPDGGKLRVSEGEKWRKRKRKKEDKNKGQALAQQHEEHCFLCIVKKRKEEASGNQVGGWTSLGNRHG